MPTISIAMATYNGAKYLREQLDSFAAQTRLPDELVISDDASTDDTVLVAETFAKASHFPVRIHRNEKNIGLNQNFSRALSLTAGDIVFISDQDDIWLPIKLERMVAIMAETRRPAATCDAIIMGAGPPFNGRSAMAVDAELAYPAPAPPRTGAGCCCAITREYLQASLPIPPGAIYDIWLNTIAIMLDLQTVIAEPLQYWRKHDNNAAAYLARRHSRPAVNPRRDWPLEMTNYDACISRAQAVVGTYPSAVQHLPELVSNLERKRDALGDRLALLGRPRLTRAAPVLFMLASGGYAQFNGLRSAVADLLRS